LAAWMVLAERRKQLVAFVGNGDAGLAEDVGDLGFVEARGVVFEGELVFLFVDVKAPEAIGVGEFAEAAELFEAQRRLQLVGDFKKCHKRKYTGKR
jgi:hypothetical protein